MTWDKGDIAIAISATWMNLDTGMPCAPNHCPVVFGQYHVRNVEISPHPVTGEEVIWLDLAEFHDEVWVSYKFMKKDDPTSIQDDGIDIPVKKNKIKEKENAF
jgi:hypothetical protein